MGVKCRSRNCDKEFKTTSNRNRHEKEVGHGPSDNNNASKIRYSDEKQAYECPSEKCDVTSKYKKNIVKHLRNGCKAIRERKKKYQNNK